MRQADRHRLQDTLETAAELIKLQLEDNVPDDLKDQLQDLKTRLQELESMLPVDLSGVHEKLQAHEKNLHKHGKLHDAHEQCITDHVRRLDLLDVGFGAHKNHLHEYDTSLEKVDQRVQATEDRLKIDKERIDKDYSGYKENDRLVADLRTELDALLTQVGTKADPNSASIETRLGKMPATSTRVDVSTSADSTLSRSEVRVQARGASHRVQRCI